MATERAAQPRDEGIDLSDIPETDFSKGVRGKYHPRTLVLEAENERLREALASTYEATADLLDHVTGMSEGEPTPIFEAAERALAHAAQLLGRTVHEP